MLTFTQGVAHIRGLIAARRNIGAGNCKLRTREAFGVPSNGSRSAAQSWEWSKDKHHETDPSKAPANTFGWMTGGGHGFGHVVVNLGGGRILTPGGPADLDHWYETTAAALLRSWGNLRWVGWTYSIDGRTPARATVKPAPAPTPPKPVQRGKEVALRITHASLQGTDSPAAQRADIEGALLSGAHFVGFTEVDKNNAPIIDEVAKRAGYGVVHGKWHESVAYRFADARKLKGGTSSVLIPGRAKQWPNRAFTYVTVEHEHLGRLTHAVAHALPRDYEATPHRLNVGYWRKVGAWLRWKTKWGLVFVSADTNVDDRTDDKGSSTAPLAAAGVATCWDELRSWPDTHDTRTIDVIGRVKSARVRVVKASLLPKRNSDHRAVQAAYAVRVK